MSARQPTRNPGRRPGPAGPPPATADGRRRPVGRGPMSAMGMPAEKAMTFGPSAKRLLRPARARSARWSIAVLAARRRQRRASP